MKRSIAGPAFAAALVVILSIVYFSLDHMESTRSVANNTKEQQIRQVIQWEIKEEIRSKVIATFENEELISVLIDPFPVPTMTRGQLILLSRETCGPRPLCIVGVWDDANIIPRNGFPQTREQVDAQLFGYARIAPTKFETALWNCKRFPALGAGECFANNWIAEVRTALSAPTQSIWTIVVRVQEIKDRGTQFLEVDEKSITDCQGNYSWTRKNFQCAMFFLPQKFASKTLCENVVPTIRNERETQGRALGYFVEFVGCVQR